MSRRPWTAQAFKRDFPADIPNSVRRPLREVCNTALRNGLTREDVVDVFAKLARSHPDVLPFPAVQAALVLKAAEKETRPPSPPRQRDVGVDS